MGIIATVTQSTPLLRCFNGEIDLLGIPIASPDFKKEPLQWQTWQMQNAFVVDFANIRDWGRSHLVTFTGCVPKHASRNV